MAAYPTKIKDIIRKESGVKFNSSIVVPDFSRFTEIDHLTYALENKEKEISKLKIILSWIAFALFLVGCYFFGA